MAPRSKLAMTLLEHGPDIDHRVDIGSRRRISADRRLVRVCKKVAQRSHTAGARRGILCIGEGENAPAAVCLGRIPEANRLGVRETNDRCRVEAHADHETFGQILMARFGEEERRLVLGRRSRRVVSMLDEISLHLRRIDPFAVRRRLHGRAEHFGPLAIEFDQLLGNGLPFRRVGVEQRGCAPTPQTPPPVSIPD